MMSEDVDVNVDIIYRLDSDEAKRELAEIARREREARASVRQFARESFLIFNQSISLYRTVLDLTGGAMDDILSSTISVIQGTISVALATSILAEAQTLLGNVAAFLSLTLAGVALAKSTTALGEALLTRMDVEEVMNRQKMNAADIGARMRAFYGGGL